MNVNRLALLTQNGDANSSRSISAGTEGWGMARGSYFGFEERGCEMSTLRGEHMQPSTHKVVNFKVEIAHGPTETVYKVWVLLLGAKWHEIEGGTVLGATTPQTTPVITARVIDQLDQLDIAKLNGE